MTSGRVSKDTPYSRGYDTVAGFETADFVKEKGVGGATVERLRVVATDLMVFNSPALSGRYRINIFFRSIHASLHRQIS